MALNLKLDEIKALIGQIETEIETLEQHKVKASSTKARALLQKVKTECHTLRVECLEFTKSLSKKKSDPVAVSPTTPATTPAPSDEETPEETPEEVAVSVLMDMSQETLETPTKPKRKPRKKKST